MNQAELVDQWVDLDQQIKALTRQQKAIEECLGAQQAGTTLVGVNKRVLVRDRAVLKPDQLEDKVSPAVWRRITKRVPVAGLLKAEVLRGKIDQDTVDACSGRSKVWFEATM